MSVLIVIFLNLQLAGELMGKTILVVDDSSTIVKIVSFALRDRGFNVLTACDGMEAMEKISKSESPVSLVITDLNMPNVDGYALIDSLRNSPDHNETPIIILSSEQGEVDKERGKALGASAYLVKPFKSSTLIAEVDKQLA